MKSNETTKEIVRIFTELSEESQSTFLMWARIAHTSEQAVRKAINRALSGEDAAAVVNKDLGRAKNHGV